MSTALITVCEGIPSAEDRVVISPAVIPFLLAAGYIHISEAPTALIHQILREQGEPPFVPNVDDAA